MWIQTQVTCPAQLFLPFWSSICLNWSWASSLGQSCHRCACAPSSAAIQSALCTGPESSVPGRSALPQSGVNFFLMCLLRVLSVINNYNQNGLILEASYCFTVLCLIAFISTALVSQWLSETFLGFTLTQGKQNQTIFVRLGGDFEQVRQENENFNSTAKEHMLVFSCVGSWNFTATLNKLLQQFLKNAI